MKFGWDNETFINNGLYVLTMSKITLEKIKIKDLIAYTNNAKLHDPFQVEKIRDSIISFGYNDPIAVDENNEIIEGHGRLMAFKQIDTSGEKEIEVIRIVGLNEAQKKSYRIAHNKINLDTGWDLDKLGKEFNNLEDTDFLTDTGFSLKEITEVWESKGKDKSNSELIEQDKSSTISHTCPECGHSWEETIKKSRSRE
jgi:hypothetical protein